MTTHFDHGFSITMTMAEARYASHAGNCDQEVAELTATRKIARQLDAIGPEKIRAELAECTDWDVSDDAANRQRIVWIAAGNICEEKETRL